MAVHTVLPSPHVPQVVPFPSTRERITTQAQLVRVIQVRLAEGLYGEGRGNAYAANVLQNTKPSRTVSLDVLRNPSSEVGS